jgi:DNA-directed RNA polymerase subunit RPC12/RpoP
MPIAILFFVAIAVLVTGAVLYFRTRNHQTGHYGFFHCSGCRQKVRYLASKAGRGGMCPRCGRRWTLPTVSQESAYTVRSDDGYQGKAVGKRRTKTPGVV